jgi:hypothetical protein
MVNTELISRYDRYRTVNEFCKTGVFGAAHRFFARFGRLTKTTGQTIGATEVVLARTIHSLLLTKGSFCRGALTDGA